MCDRRTSFNHGHDRKLARMWTLLPGLIGRWIGMLWRIAPWLAEDGVLVASLGASGDGPAFSAYWLDVLTGGEAT